MIRIPASFSWCTREGNEFFWFGVERRKQSYQDMMPWWYLLRGCCGCICKSKNVAIADDDRATTLLRTFLELEGGSRTSNQLEHGCWWTRGRHPPSSISNGRVSWTSGCCCCPPPDLFGAVWVDNLALRLSHCFQLRGQRNLVAENTAVGDRCFFPRIEQWEGEVSIDDGMVQAYILRVFWCPIYKYSRWLLVNDRT